MKPRYSAFLLHLLISGVIGLIAVCIVFFVWYPDPLQDAVGVTEIFLILLSVDIVIGPLLTLLVYKPGKPSLKFDLSVIALLQLVALCYGMNTVFQGRPAFQCAASFAQLKDFQRLASPCAPKRPTRPIPSAAGEQKFFYCYCFNR